MKISDDFDARRLRGRRPSSWGLRLAMLSGALLLALGGLLSLAMLAIWLDVGIGLTPPEGSSEIALLAGVAMLASGGLLMRGCRRRLGRADRLDMAPHLLKRRG